MRLKPAGKGGFALRPCLDIWRHSLCGHLLRAANPCRDLLAARKGAFGNFFLDEQAPVVAISRLSPRGVDMCDENAAHLHASRPGYVTLNGCIIFLVGFDRSR